MESTELTEDQFTLIKMFCMAHSLAVVCLHPNETDTPERVEQHKKNLDNMRALEKAGFVKDHSDQCKGALEYARATGARTFDTFAITEEAYRMFSAPEGSVN
jgi:hypothetical protein